MSTDAFNRESQFRRQNKGEHHIGVCMYLAAARGREYT